MTYPAPLLPDLLVGWQKVADRYNMPIYVFQTGDAYHAVSNETPRRGAPSGHLGSPGAGSGASLPIQRWHHHRLKAGWVRPFACGGNDE